MSRTAKPRKTGLGKRLRELRQQRNLTQPQLAHALGELAPGTVSRWERETGSPQAEQLLQLAAFFDVSLDYLLKGDPNATTVHSPQLHKFLATTAGKWAKDHKLVDMLLHLRYPGGQPSIEFYRSVTTAVRDEFERASDDGTAPSDGPKKPQK